MLSPLFNEAGDGYVDICIYFKFQLDSPGIPVNKVLS